MATAAWLGLVVVAAPGPVLSGAAIPNHNPQDARPDGRRVEPPIPVVKAWEFLTDSALPIPPLVDQDQVFVPLGGGRVVCLERESGSLRWSAELGGSITAPMQEGSTGIYVLTRVPPVTPGSGADDALASDIPHRPAATLRLLEKATGVTVWSREYTRSFASPMAFDGETLYIGSTDGALYAIDSLKGEVKWRARTQDAVRGEAVIAGGRIYFGSDDGALRAVDQESGEEIWMAQTADPVRSRPLIRDNAAFFGSGDGNIYRVDLATGKTTWRIKTGAAVEAPPLMVGDTLIIGSFDNFIYALSPSSGSTIWRRRFELRFLWAPTPQGDALFVAPYRGSFLTLLRIADGRQTGSYRLDRETEIVASPTVLGEMMVLPTNRGLLAILVPVSGDGG